MLRSTGRTLTVASDESVLAALRRADVEVFTSCGEGTCGSCETTVLEGQVDHRDAVLSEAERAANDCLMVCVSRSCSPQLVLDL